MKGGLVNLIALLVLIAVIWFGGHYLEWATKTRVLLIIGVLLLWLIMYVIQRLRAIRTANLIERRLREDAASQIASSRPAERDQLEDLERRLNEALHALKSSKLGKSALAELPWYMIIGPPGSGKSTALQESGLEFPQMSQGLNGLQGIGGTRNCEWWFTSEGILLDTAGRYTTVEEDREEWLSFLKMIKVARKKTPVNGAIVAISIADLLAADDAELARHSKAVRERIDELGKELEEVFPVYLVFTKCDLMSGFVDFFEAFSREERAQVWGFTFPYEGLSTDRYRSIFKKECQALTERLGTMRLKLLGTDHPPDKLERLFGFPLQFAAVHEKLGRFVEMAFRENPFQESPILRGFYFTSGTQEGKPIDQIMGALRQAFAPSAPAAPAAPAPAPGVPAALGAPPPPPPPPPAAGMPMGAPIAPAPPSSPGMANVEKKSYFITTLFKKIIFSDSDLARSLASTEKRRRLAALATIAGAILFSLSLVSAFTYSFFRNRALTARVEVGIKALQQVRKDERASLEVRLTALEQLRVGVAELHEHDSKGTPLGLTWGLYQGGDLAPAARMLYFDELRALLLEPCMTQLGKELAAAADPQADLKALKKKYGYNHDQQFYDGLYRMLRVYLMLANQLAPAPVDIEDQVKIQDRWLAGLGSQKAKLKEQAEVQLAFLGTQADHAAEWAATPDEKLVHRVRKKLEANYWVSQSYTQIRDARAGQAEKETLEGLLGGNGVKLFGAAEPISAVFSKSEWDEYFERAIGEKSEYLAAQYAEMDTPKDKDTIEKELREYYVMDGRQRWLRFLNRLTIVEFKNLGDASRKLDLLTSGSSPLPKLFNEVWLRQYILTPDQEKARLTQRPPPVKPDPNDGPIKHWQIQLQEALTQLSGALGELAKKPQGERFWPLAEKDDLKQLDPVQKAFADTRKVLFDTILPQVPSRQEDYAKRLFTELLANAQKALLNESQAEANAWWKQNVHDVYSSRCARRYPFKDEAKDEAPLREVAELFNVTGGTIAKAKKALARLKSYEINGRGLVTLGARYGKGIKSAERVSKALFSTKETLDIKLKIKLIKRTGVRNLRLVVGATAFKHSDLPPGQRMELVWNDKPGAKVSVRGVTQEEWAHRDFGASAWGLLRLLAAGTFDPENSKDRRYRYSWSFKLGENNRLADVEFEVPYPELGTVFSRTLFQNLDPPPEKVDQ